MKTLKGFAAIAAVLASSVSIAGSFESWTMQDKRLGGTVVVVSFTGDGVTEDAGVDLEVPAGYKVQRSVVKVEGSVCAANDKIIRVVPPSGAGKPLPSKSVDYCSFSLKRIDNAKVMAGALSLKQVFNECAAPSGMQKCGVQDVAVSE